MAFSHGVLPRGTMPCLFANRSIVSRSSEVTSRCVKSLSERVRVPLRTSRHWNSSSAFSMCSAVSAPSRPYGRFCVLMSGCVMKYARRLPAAAVASAAISASTYASIS